METPSVILVTASEKEEATDALTKSSSSISNMFTMMPVSPKTYSFSSSPPLFTANAATASTATATAAGTAQFLFPTTISSSTTPMVSSNDTGLVTGNTTSVLSSSALTFSTSSIRSTESTSGIPPSNESIHTVRTSCLLALFALAATILLI
ncbi:hypothetical protein EC973_004858 [Apophysomyces ossiformis]|uniref:Uncharacterized protein n=1 Tax=Apophysomyces ossiformis TaxID=679940 RepID=A0A8H7BKU8_9FUNG|nr:hypothetical protein EC973_004858 [Apophysomyces ossiformis]